MVVKIDAALTGPLRWHRGVARGLLLGPTGLRLSCDYLDPAPGLGGIFDYIHKTNIPSIARMVITDSPRGEAISLQGVETVGSWKPSHLITELQVASLQLTERRWITADDVLISSQRWVNTGSEPRYVYAAFDQDAYQQVASGHIVMSHRHPQLPDDVTIVAGSSHPGIWEPVEIPPGQELTIVLAAVIGLASESSEQDLITRCDEVTSTDPAELLAQQEGEYQEWFDGVPTLETSSPVLDKAWAYRWYILRKNMARPQYGRMPGYMFWEGRSHKLRKVPWQAQGWDFNKFVGLSMPFHIADMRWHRRREFIESAMSQLPGLHREDGRYGASTVVSSGKSYNNFIPWAVAQYQNVYPQSAVVPQIQESLAASVAPELSGPDVADGLPIQRDHKLTGKEYQPSYWYFTDYDVDPRDENSFMPLRRVDRAIYLYQNLTGLAQMATDADRKQKYTAAAQKVRDAINSLMWDPETGFYYDVHPAEPRRALVKNVVGFYPWWAKIIAPTELQGITEQLQPADFGRLYVPTTAASEEAYSPNGGWFGHYIKGRHGCMWNGSSWPYTTSLVAAALGETAQQVSERAHTDGARANARSADVRRIDAKFSEVMWRYIDQHFPEHDLSRPGLVEHYDSEIGEPLGPEMDYSHSMFIDLIIRYVMGVQVADGQISRVAPVPMGLEWAGISGLAVGESQHDIFIDFSHKEPRIDMKVSR